MPALPEGTVPTPRCGRSRYKGAAVVAPVRPPLPTRPRATQRGGAPSAQIAQASGNQAVAKGRMSKLQELAIARLTALWARGVKKPATAAAFLLHQNKHKLSSQPISA